MKYRLNTSGFLMNIKGSSGITIKRLNTFDWLCDLPQAQSSTDFVEVQFKSTRKGYYLNSNKIPLQMGDVVAVEAFPGHDIGTVTLTGQLVLKQMQKTRYRFDQEVKRVYRKARPVDMEKYEESKAKEHDTMIRSRQIAKDLGLDMKIGDVEYQGDGNKAIFYYIADGRVDFRELIKVLADAFHVKIEMKQIGARQEAGRIGGLGPCGREMCCSAWMTNFVSVSTTAARYQDLSLNPQKLAGQCAKLKCCMNYENDVYVEASREFPPHDTTLETKDGTWYPVKKDILRREISYSTAKNSMANLITIPLSRVFAIIALNKQGIKVDSLNESEEDIKKESAFGDVLGNNDYTRFDRPKGKRDKGRHNRDRDRDRNRGNREEREKTTTAEEPKAQAQNRPQPQTQPQNSQKPHGDRPAGFKRHDSWYNQKNGQKPEQRQEQKQGPKPDQHQGHKPNHNQGQKQGPKQDNPS